ncbi:AfsR/SARP family transcriptional regulator [Embleya sp. AB8]|uniref:AfsR/SARP family transcriptional regulator n=1 Tax=Embleya sp. AB8 TaxID=3156304 RepID=UPI003C738298
MRYEILGPVRVVGVGGARALAAAKPEILLAALLARRDQVLTVDQLVAELWAADDPARPRQVRPTVHVYVSRLRSFLRASAPARSRSIVTTAGGYVLRSTPEVALDADEFHHLVEQGREASRAGRRREGAERYAAALKLWRGAPYERVEAGPIVRAHAARLDAARLDCQELLVEAQFELGRYRESVARLYALTAEYPLHEAFARQLMIALHVCGRRADALVVYRDSRARLRELLGLEPGEPLREAHRAVLAGTEPPGLRTHSLAH